MHTTENAASGTAEHRAIAAAKTGGDGRGHKVRAMLKARLGEETFMLWFNALEFDAFDGRTVTVSVPVKFLRNWIATHFTQALLECCRAEFAGAERVEVVLREPAAAQRAAASAAANDQASASAGQTATSAASAPGRDTANTPLPARPAAPAAGRTGVGGFEGSPLDWRYTFESFVVGASNRMAHAGAIQVAETVMTDNPGFNPLYIHSAVGLGKTHLLHAIAWEVRRRAPQAQVLYLTAERFRFQFIEALRSQDPLSFKDKFRSIHMLLIDDLEFMQGERTEQEFEHVINALLDGGKQVVVASARAPSHTERLNERMRSRLQRGLVTEIGTLDHDLRFRVLERRLAEKRANDPSFTLSRDVLEYLAEHLTESGRELEGAITRLHMTANCLRSPITLENAEAVIRDLVQGPELRRIKIEDIMRIVSRHYGVTKSDLLSERRHRSVVWPRQIGMYLAKQLTQRSLPEIGRRFGNRDHTTVLHAIRKIEGELAGNPRLRDELDELKKHLSH